MNVLMINGSPHREGNVYLALHEMEKVFWQEDVETEIVHIGNQAIRGCIACYTCKEKGKCVFDDLVNQVATKFEQCDGLVIGSPVYYASANGTIRETENMNGKWMKKTISTMLAASLLSGCVSQSAAPQQETSNEETPVGSVWQPREDTERTQRARETYEELFGDLELAINEQNPDFTDIMNNFIYGDTYHQSDLLTTEEKELIALVSLTTQQSYELLKQRSVAAVNVGLTPEEVMEAVVHCSPYVGMATTYDAVSAVAEAFTANGIKLPLQSQTMVSDDGRYDGGAAAQHELFGMNPQPGSSDITDYVTAWCFGDFYTRGSIPIETREMLTMCVLANMGVSQFSAHVTGTYQAGHSKEKILAAMAQMMPYMGTPRTLTAVGIIHEVLPEDKTEESNADDSGSTGVDIEADAPGNLLSENFTGRAWAK